MSGIFNLALCQTKASFDKDESMAMVSEYVIKAADMGCQMISLPEMWNCPYDTSYFKEYEETENGRSVELMSDLARQNNIYLIGGSIPERDGDNIYNTCFIFDSEGKMIGKHRKAHLFDIDVPGGIRFMESDVLTAGDANTVIDTEFCRIGIAICYDIRFPKLFTRMADEGAKLVILPGAFNMTTGPAHWELLIRARALDNQLYFAANSPARDMQGPYQSYGNSMVVSPWGEICGKTDSSVSIVYSTVNPDYVDQVRQQIPIIEQRKPELY